MRTSRRKIDGLRLALMLCVFFGFVIGVIYGKTNGSGAAAISVFFQEPLTLAAFLEILVKYGKYPVIIWFLAFIPPGSLLSFPLLVYRGAALGFSAALINYGLIKNIILLLPQNLILIPAYIYITHESLKFAADKNPLQSAVDKRYLICIVTALFFVVLAGFAEIYCIPVLWRFL